MFSSYRAEDVTILLKDITGLVPPMATAERERLIQAGRHYSEMLPLEYEPTEKYMEAYRDALTRYAEITARATACLAEEIYAEKGADAVLVSLARAGTPIGILLKRYLRKRFGADVAHYTISIIRGRGIDANAMAYILARHAPAALQFVDGWTGKGAIARTLAADAAAFPGVSAGLAVLSDPAYVAEKCGTHEDFLIASSCLNATVSGLLSRTVLRADIIGADDFHGAAFYEELRARDLTYDFIDAVEAHFPTAAPPKPDAAAHPSGLSEVRRIAADFGIADINLVKPGIGEATRVLLRRLPWKLLVHSTADEARLGHLYQLAKEKGVEVVSYPLRNYLACGLIRALADN